MGNRKRYPTDLSDIEWNQIKNLIPQSPSRRGRPRNYSSREIVNAILYVLRTSAHWYMLPNDFGPSYKTVHYYFSKWTREGVWDAMMEHLRCRVRQQMSRNQAPHMGIIDSQSVKTGDQDGPRGYDAGKKVKGRKRHILVDSLGFPLEIAVTPASESDQEGAKGLFNEALPRYRSLDVIYGDKAYGGQLGPWVSQFQPYGELHIEVVSKPPEQKGFKVLPKRWLVERTFGWLQKFRRLDKDRERRLDHSRAMVQIALNMIMLNRLAQLKAG